MTAPPSIVYYISGHGFGHATRSVAIINQLRLQRPDIPIHIRSWAASQIFNEMCPGVPVHHCQLDIGVVQADGISMDIDTTLVRCQEILDQADLQADQELDALKALNPGCIVCDIPPMANRMAKRLGIASVTVTNFTWDWIYDGWLATHPRAGELSKRMFHDYACSDCLLRLPYAGDLPAFDTVIDTPMLGRPAQLDAAVVRQRLGLNHESRPLVLLSFGGMGFQSGNLAQLAELADYCLLTTFPVNHPDVHLLPSLDNYGIGYPDLVGAVDVVVTKPGYGIVSECAVNQTRMLYTDRGPFREYDEIVAELDQWNCGVYIERDRLRRGDFKAELDRLMTLDPGEAPRADEAIGSPGSPFVADHILGYFHGRRL